MAITKIMPVRTRLDHLLDYVGNVDKTGNDSFTNLTVAIDYASDPAKTERRFFVTGINCQPKTAHQEMLAALALTDKPVRVEGYHLIQSFAPGEVDAAVAHEIGVQLAERLFGENFQCVVATHKNTDCMHNHIALCSTSFIDGHRYHSCRESYRKIQRVSDDLCREYHISVIDNPKHGRTKHYGEWRAEREGRPTWRGTVRSDIDECIEKARTTREFCANLKAMGYEYKVGKDISVRPPGKERYLRLGRNYGDGYTPDGIRERLLANHSACLPVPKYRAPNFTPPKKLPPWAKGSIVALHRHYLYLFGYYQKHGNPSTNNRMHYLLREELAKLDAFTEDIRLLGREKIDTAEQLLSFKGRCENEIAALTAERNELRRAARNPAHPSFKDGIPEGIRYRAKDNPRHQEINQALKKLRKQVRQCDRIERRSSGMPERIEVIEQDEDKKLQPTKHAKNNHRQRSRQHDR